MYKEISRRSMYYEEEGSTCGPVSVTSIDTEIVVEENGQLVYLHAQWVDAAGDEIVFEATAESVYDIYEKLNANADNFDALITERDRIEVTRIKEDERFDAYYAEMKEMIIAEMEAHGIENYIYDGEDA